jgi:AcrR family transcriptional regulator
MLQPWHDFYTLIGESAATLVGLMFIAASLGAGVFTHERQVGLRTFLSPTVVAFSAVLTTSLLGLLPISDPRLLAALAAGMGAVGLVYSWRVWRRMVDGGIAPAIDREDQFWYVVAPAAAYAVLAGAGIAIYLAPQTAGAILAIAAWLLLLAGIRNAWDMTTWVLHP